MIQTERPLGDGRPTVVLVFNELRVGGGRLTQMWLGRLRAFDAAGWATHAALVNRDAALPATLRTLVARGLLPAGTIVHHYPARDRRLRPSFKAPLARGESLDPRIGDWLDWLTSRLPGAVVVADSPAAYPYVAQMSNPLVRRLAGIHLNHLTAARAGDPALAAMTPRFAERFEPCHAAFDALVVMSTSQAEDLRRRLGPDTVVEVIPPAIVAPTATVALSEPPARTTIVSVGPLERAARHGHVLRAAAPALAADQALRVSIVGEGEGADELRALAEELGIASRVSVAPPSADPSAAMAGARLLVSAARRESWPVPVAHALASDVPVVAYDVRYGPAELLEGVPGAVVADGDLDALTAAVSGLLADPPAPGAVRAAAGPALAATDPAEVGRRWVDLAARLAAQACDPGVPALLVEAPAATSRVLRFAGVLAGSGAPLSAWRGEYDELLEPAAWLVPPGPVAPAPGRGPVRAVVGRLRGARRPGGLDPGQADPVRDAVVQLRTNALALVVSERRTPVRVELSGGAAAVPVHALAFQPRVIAGRTGRALLRRHDDGTMWAHPLDEILTAADEDGRLLVRLAPDAPASDVTHAVDWTLTIAWATLRTTDRGAEFRGVLTASGIVPETTPGICVSDVGGYSRVVGALEPEGEPRLDDGTWTARVRGALHVDPLVATTQLARGALGLHMGFRGLLVPVGGVWADGRASTALTCDRGTVTLLPSPSGRILVAPGRGTRARASGAVRSVLRRG